MTTFFYRTLCSTGIFRTRGIFRILSNIHDVKFYSQPCVTENPRQIQNTAKHLSRNILFKTLSNPYIFRTISIFRTLLYSEIKAYSEPCRVSKMVHFIKNPVKLLQIQKPYIFKTFAYSEPVCLSYSLVYQLFFRTSDVLLYPQIKIWTTVQLFFFSVTHYDTS